jgi:3-isopropylmalate/(R)-2-methylmalate dehydratase large subunit
MNGVNENELLEDPMPMTISEKILAAHTSQGNVRPGELIEAKLSFVFGNDITAPMAIQVFKQAGGQHVFDPERVGMIPDHFIPNKDIKSATQAKILRDFARERNLPYYFEVGRVGIEHALLPEKGIVLPGDLIIGADSHTCTYGALGAFATGVGSTDLGAAMITGTSWFKVPPSLKFVFEGQRGPWIGGKDLILYLIGRIGVDGA